MTVETLKKKLVSQAIQTVREINKTFYNDSTKKKPLLEEEGKNTLFLQFMLKKIPKTKLIKMIKVNLPHSLVKDSEVCLITGDVDKNDHKAEIEPDVLYYKTLLEKHGVTQISQVVTLRQLRTEYKPYEAKQKLLAAYDLFLADSKIIECLPRILSRHFFKKRKFPIQINLKTSNLKQQVEKALSEKMIYISGKGNSCISEVACLDMTDTEILENILAMAEALFENVPGSWDNIMGIYLKTALSKACPVYVSYESPNDVELPEVKDEDDIVMDELSTIPDIKVKVHSSGKVETLYVKEEEETSSAEHDENNSEKSSVDSDVLKNELCNVEQFETKMTSNEENKKMALKRKKNKSKSLILNSELSTSDQTPVKPTKKRKIEGVNMKKYQEMKESKKSKRKNHKKNKQQRI